MPGCITEPLHKNCCIFNEGLCFECVGAFTNEQKYYNDIIVGHDITAIILIIISIYNIFLCYRTCKKNHKKASSNSNNSFNGYIGDTQHIQTSHKNQEYDAVNNEENDDEHGDIIAMTRLQITTSQQSEPDGKEQEEDDQNGEYQQHKVQHNDQEQYVEYEQDDDKIYIPWMRINNAAFAFLTAGFGLARGYFELGKPLAIAGASHNWNEWAFLCFVIYKNKKERSYGFFICSLWILFIILMVILIPTFPAYLLVEQISGIAMDFLLPIIWFIMYLQNKNNNSKKPFNYIFIIPFIAHLVHLLFTILPLVILNFIQNQNEVASRFLEFCIYISAPITHILYTKFTSMHEKYIDLPSWKYNKDINDIDNNLILNHPKFKFISHPTMKIGFWYIIAIIVGSLPTFIIPLGIRHSYGGYCHHDNDNIVTGYGLNTSLCNNYSLPGDDAVIGTAIANIYDEMSVAFEEYINDKYLVKTAREYDGNVFYYFTKSINNDNSYVFIEAWVNLSVAQKWINSLEVDEVFNDYTYQMMVDGGLEINGYIPLNTYCDTDGKENEDEDEDDEMGVGAIRHVFESWNGCKDLWKDMNNFTNCEWIYNPYGCDHINIIDQEEGKRVFIMGDGTEYHNTIYYANKREINDNLIYYNYSFYVEELNRYPTINLIYDADNYGKDKCIGIFGFETDINIISIDELYQYFINGNIPYLQSKYETNSPKALGIPDNLASRTLLKIDDPLEFVETIRSFQANATTHPIYDYIAPYMYDENEGQIIFNNLIYNGFDEIQSLYHGPLGASLSAYHSFLMDPIIEEYIESNIITITIISNLYQESKFDQGCDYSYPMMISVQLLNQYPIKIETLLYNTPKYSTIEQVNVLTNCQYLSVKERNNLTTNKDFQDLLYEMWNGFKIINGSFGELWEPYLSHNCSVLFNNTEYFGIEDVTQFHDELSERIFGGFRFYVIALIGNDGFVTIHLRGSVISYDLAINFNYNFRMSIEYRVNKNDEIISIIYHIDTTQLKEIMQKFNIL